MVLPQWNKINLTKGKKLFPLMFSVNLHHLLLRNSFSAWLNGCLPPRGISAYCFWVLNAADTSWLLILLTPPIFQFSEWVWARKITHWAEPWHFLSSYCSLLTEAVFVFSKIPYELMQVHCCDIDCFFKGLLECHLGCVTHKWNSYVHECICCAGL